jgi:hypothetical protein
MPTTRKYRRLKGLDYFNCSKIGVRRKLRLVIPVPAIEPILSARDNSSRKAILPILSLSRLGQGSPGGKPTWMSNISPADSRRIGGLNYSER